MQDRHSELAAPEQVRHDESQLKHFGGVVTEDRNSPTLQLAKHCLAEGEKCRGRVQDRHSELLPPEQVVHEEAH